MHLYTKFKRNLSRNVTCRAHTRYPLKYDLWTYKRWKTGGSITKNYRCVHLTMMDLHKKSERNWLKNVATRVHKRQQPKYDLRPYKRRNTGSSITKNYRCVELTMMDLYIKSERNQSKNVAARVHTRQQPKYDLWTYKRHTIGGRQYHQ